MRLFDLVAVGLAVSAAVSYLVIHLARVAGRKSDRPSRPGCAAATPGLARRPGGGQSRGTGCPGCG